MTVEQQQRYDKIKEYLGNTRIDSGLDWQLKHMRPDFAEKVRKAYKEEQECLQKLIDEL